MPRQTRKRSSTRSAMCPPGTTHRRTKSAQTRSRSTRGRHGSAHPGQRGRAGSQRTTDHEFIRRWAEERRAEPACVRGTGGAGDTGMLRLDFPRYSGRQSLKHIPWDEWFEKFDEKNLALLYQNRTKDGRKSNFNKLVER